MYHVFVQAPDGQPLMPTPRFGRVRRMLRDGLARPVCTKPFTIRLLHEPQTRITQELYGGIDPGRTNIGAAVVDGKGDIVYAAEFESRNREIPKLMAERRQHRQASRRGERLRRKRRAKACGTTTVFPNGRKLPGYEDGRMNLKDIINTEARFNNRKRPAGWITPTARQCVQTHVGLMRKIERILPVSRWTVETNGFAFMKMDDGGVRGVDFQNGRMKGFANAREYVRYLQNDRCAVCGGDIEHFHHLIEKSKNGSDLPENLVGLCRTCHEKVHISLKAGRLSLKKIGKKKKYGALSILNIAIPFILETFPKALACTGWQTSRKRGGMAKSHWLDAACIAVVNQDIDPLNVEVTKPFAIRQFRNHDRSLIHSQRERTYRLDGKVVARNRRRRFGQNVDSLEDWRLTHPRDVGCLCVDPSRRRYNNPDRMLPGAVFVFDGQRYVMSGQICNGRYLRAFGCGKRNFPAAKCEIVTRESLVYM